MIIFESVNYEHKKHVIECNIPPTKMIVLNPNLYANLTPKDKIKFVIKFGIGKTIASL